MVGLIVKAPLADNKVGSSILDILDHILELFLLVGLELLKLLDARDVQMVLGFGTGRFEGACEDGEFGVADVTRHLGVRHILVDEDSLDEGGVGERAADFAIYFDEIEGDVFSFEVGDC